MFLTKKQIFIRNVKRVLYALGCFVAMFIVIFLMMLMMAKHNEISSWFYSLLGM